MRKKEKMRGNFLLVLKPLYIHLMDDCTKLVDKVRRWGTNTWLNLILFFFFDDKEFTVIWLHFFRFFFDIQILSAFSTQRTHITIHIRKIQTWIKTNMLSRHICICMYSNTFIRQTGVFVCLWHQINIYIYHVIFSWGWTFSRRKEKKSLISLESEPEKKFRVMLIWHRDNYICSQYFFCWADTIDVVKLSFVIDTPNLDIYAIIIFQVKLMRGLNALPIFQNVFMPFQKLSSAFRRSISSRSNKNWRLIFHGIDSMSNGWISFSRLM